MFIAGSGRVGRVESIYASLAHNIHTKTEIRTAKSLIDRMSPNIANDKDFEMAFAHAYVSKTKLERYYLTMLERTAGGKELPELVPSDDTKAVNLEHVLPINPSDSGNEDPSDGADDTGRIGNLVLLNAKINAAIGNESFEKKRPLLAASEPFAATANERSRITKTGELLKSMTGRRGSRQACRKDMVDEDWLTPTLPPIAPRDQCDRNAGRALIAVAFLKHALKA